MQQTYAVHPGKRNPHGKKVCSVVQRSLRQAGVAFCWNTHTKARLMVQGRASSMIIMSCSPVRTELPPDKLRVGRTQFVVILTGK